ncbi:TPA: glycosyltransferase family 2 protein [Streptococcus suis]|nr:glycosyltransferase [Streptococcus suis]NQN64175.1 glycosyltransferase [Streptococcus suis]HEL1824235.1 glycosyltransferase [Streptococcus suis]HEM5193649.1 glycosyltransferase [Streptococcus suis]
MNTPLISIIVPVYNVENYLDECIRTVLAQTYSNWELLLINDGSTDSSGTICDDYAKGDERIYIKHIKKKQRCVRSPQYWSVPCKRGVSHFLGL